MEEAAAVPEPFRCRRSDGKGWQCARRAKDGFSFCELHVLQARRRQSRKPVPDSLKLPRRRRGGVSKGKLPAGGPKKGRRGKKGREKVGNAELAMELIRLVLRQMLRRREEKEKKRREAVEAAEEKGKGAVAIGLGNAGEPIDRRMALNSSSFLRWCFRSKNVERPPLVASAQVRAVPLMISSGRVMAVCEKSRKRMCQLCHESHTRLLVPCSSCKKVLFCRTCVKKWYTKRPKPEQEALFPWPAGEGEDGTTQSPNHIRYARTHCNKYPDMAGTKVKMACPICLGTCIETKDFVVKDAL